MKSSANPIKSQQNAYGVDQAEDRLSRTEAETKEIVHPKVLKRKNKKEDHLQEL